MSQRCPAFRGSTCMSIYCVTYKYGFKNIIFSMSFISLHPCMASETLGSKKANPFLAQLRGIQQLRGPFFCHFFDPPHPAWTIFMPWAWTKTDIFDPLPPHLAHVTVIEWPLSHWLLTMFFTSNEILLTNFLLRVLPKISHFLAMAAYTQYFLRFKKPALKFWRIISILWCLLSW